MLSELRLEKTAINHGFVFLVRLPGLNSHGISNLGYQFVHFEMRIQIWGLWHHLVDKFCESS